MMMMAKEGDLVRVSLPKPLGIQLEEVVPGSPGVRVAGVVEGGTAKESGVSAIIVIVRFFSSSSGLVMFFFCGLDDFTQPSLL